MDYLYIADFIKKLTDEKLIKQEIPVSCFTATAKPQVIEDIRHYFHKKLGFELTEISTNTYRKNLHYKIIETKSDQEKYAELRNLVISKDCPKIIYTSRTKRTEEIAGRLNADGVQAICYHGRMEPDKKKENQDKFMKGEVNTIVATSAFGMGVDKDNVEMVIHYDISDSLENYVQEAGRAGRSDKIEADCYVLFNEDDLNKHFNLLNQTKLVLKEIKDIWRSVKEITRYRKLASASALEIAKKAGWNEEIDRYLETKISTAIAALEESGYLKREFNSPRIYANSILSPNAEHAINIINNSPYFTDKQREYAIRIMRHLFSCKSRKVHDPDEEAEERVDYLSHKLGIDISKIVEVITLLRKEKILENARDLTAFINRGDRNSKKTVKLFTDIEEKLVSLLKDNTGEQRINLKELNDDVLATGIEESTPDYIKTILNIWDTKNYIKRKKVENVNYHYDVNLVYSKKEILNKIEIRRNLSSVIIDYLFEKNQNSDQPESALNFSVLELYDLVENSLFKATKHDIQDIEESLLYLHNIKAIKLEGGFMVIYNAMQIERREDNMRSQYTKENFAKLEEFYKNKIQQIHIVGEYARKMLNDYHSALKFVDDYFKLDYGLFLERYFSKRIGEISRTLTPKKFDELFGGLTPVQLNIIKDNNSRHIMVAAGPGSGKTKLLVHKLASLLTMEDIKDEQLLMLTFSRSAAMEFKSRLYDLLKGRAGFVEIRTYHSFCFNILGSVGNIEKSCDIIKNAVEKIRSASIPMERIRNKSVLVIDECQDINQDEYDLIKLIIENNEDIRVIMVGDDDQNIYEFRGASNAYMLEFARYYKASQYELLTNFRSKRNLVAFSNKYLTRIRNRIKTNEILPKSDQNGIVKIIEYQSEHIIEASIKMALKEFSGGASCFMTFNNDDACLVVSALNKSGHPAKLINSNQKINASAICEIRFFQNKISGLYDNQTGIILSSQWDAAKKALSEKFKRSANRDLTIRIIDKFEENYPQKYKSDWNDYLREIKIEDMYSASEEFIWVSTMHKTKGKEFDNVVLILNKIIDETDEMKRLLYVAITRAKTNLIINTNTPIFSQYKKQGFNYQMDNATYNPSNDLIIPLSHEDVFLDYFMNTQHNIDSLRSGDTLLLNESGNGMTNTSKQNILRFSGAFKNKMTDYINKGFLLVNAKVNFIVYWYSETNKQEFQVVLPILEFQKNDI